MQPNLFSQYTNHLAWISKTWEDFLTNGIKIKQGKVSINVSTLYITMISREPGLHMVGVCSS